MKHFINKLGALLLCCAATLTQAATEFLPLQEGQPLPRVKHELSKSTFNQSGWYPQSVSYAPGESNLLVGVCPFDAANASNPYYAPRCTLIRYDLQQDKWLALPDIDKGAHYSDAAYTFDGQAIFASEVAKCPVIPFVAPTRPTCRLFVLLDLNGKKIRNLSTYDQDYLYPALTRDGRKVLFWGLSNQLYPGMGGGAWDVKEFDIEKQALRQLTDYQAAFPKAAPRLMPDGRRLMLVAEEYPKRPNDEDYFVTEEKRGRFRTNYVGKFGRNMTVVVDPPRGPVKPYFPTLKEVRRNGQTVWEPVAEHMWLIVRDISRDGKLAVFDDRGIGICFRFVEEPLRKGGCFSRESYSIAASISADNSKVATVTGEFRAGINSRLYDIDVETGQAKLLALEW